MAISGEGGHFTVTRLKGTPEEVSAAWLAERRTGVGGSDVAAIMGLSKYKGAYTVWAEKRGLADGEDISGRPAVEWGNRLEPLVAAKYADEHPDRDVRRVNGVCRSSERPWALASLDYQVHDPEAGWGVLEIKTAGLRVAGDWEDGVPLYYQTQVQHYLTVTGYRWADVAVLIGGQDYREYRIQADAEDQAAIAAAVDAFWARVQSGDAPDVDAVDAASVLASHPEGGEYEEAASADDVPAVREWLDASAQAKRAKARLEKASAGLKARIGDAAGIEWDGGRVTWRRGERRQFDKKRFDAEHAGVYESYCSTVTADFGLSYKEV